MSYETIPMLFYRMHYDEKIGPNLTDEQKLTVVKRISDTTLNEPFAMSGVDYTDRFPEIKPFVKAPMSGLFLVAIMEGAMNDLGLMRDRPATAPGRKSPRRRPDVSVRRHARRRK